MEESTKMSLQCLFCFSDQFVIPEENYQPQSGDMLQCANCGKLNDYDSLVRVVKRKGTEWAKAQAEEIMNDFAEELRDVFE